MNQKKQINKDFWLKLGATFVAVITALFVFEKFIKPRLKK